MASCAGDVGGDVPVELDVGDVGTIAGLVVSAERKALLLRGGSGDGRETKWRRHETGVARPFALQPADGVEQHGAWSSVRFAVLDDQIRDGQHRPFALAVSGAQREQKAHGVEGGGSALGRGGRGTRNGKHGRAVDGSYGIFVNERQLVARPVAEAVQHGGYAAGRRVVGRAPGRVIAEGDGRAAGGPPARPGQRGAVSPEVRNGVARPAGRHEEVEEEGSAVAVAQDEGGEALAGGGAHRRAGGRGRFVEQRGDVGVVEIGAQPEAVSGEGAQPD